MNGFDLSRAQAKRLVAGTPANKDANVTCRKGATTADHDIYYANVWGPRPAPFAARQQLGHGVGRTRREAIRNAKADALLGGKEQPK
jgi:hypothetical protein